MWNNQIIKVLVKLMGRSLAWRLGRSLYMTARGEEKNEINSNGEETLISQLSLIFSKFDNQLTEVVIVDCGANIGNWAAVAIEKFEEAGVEANFLLFEPSPISHKILNQRFGILANVSLHNTALSNKSGKFDFFLGSPTGGTNSLVLLSETHNEKISVQTERGSDYFADLGIEEISLLKIDTEGNDFAVLEGFEEMLATHRIKVIQFEYNHRWLPTGKSMRSIFELAHKYGYEVGRTDPKRVEVYADWNAELDRFFEWNYIMFAPGIADQLNVNRVRWDPYNTLVTA